MACVTYGPTEKRMCATAMLPLGSSVRKYNAFKLGNPSLYLDDLYYRELSLTECYTPDHILDLFVLLNPSLQYKVSIIPIV